MPSLKYAKIERESTGRREALPTLLPGLRLNRPTAERGKSARNGLVLDPARATAAVNGRAINLTAKEFQALAYLQARSGALCSKDELASHVWPEYGGAVDDYNLEQLVSRLRRKLEPDPRHPRYLLTVRGLGYRLETDAAVLPARVRPRLPVFGAIGLAVALVALAVALMSRGDTSGPEAAPSSATRQNGWVLRDEDQFSDPDKSLFPKGSGSTNVGFIFTRGIENGEYVVRVLRGPERSGLSSTAAPVFLDSFAFETEARTNGPVQYGLTLFWGSADFVQLRVTPATAGYELFQGPEGSLRKRENSSLVNSGETPNHLRFEVRGKELAVAINGTVAETVSLDLVGRRPATPGLFLYVPPGQEIVEGSGVRVSFDKYLLFAAAQD